MAIAITDLGTNTNTTGATITLTSITVPAGSLLVVAVTEASASLVGSLADGVNTYIQPVGLQNGGAGSNGFVSVWYAANASLSSGTITFTKKNTGDAAAISAFYATGIATASPLDSAVTQTATGVGTAPSVTSGTPAQAGELFVGVSGASGTEVFTEDSGNGWAVPPSAASVVGAFVGGGTQVNAGTGTIAFAPTYGTSRNWAICALGFKPAAATARHRMLRGMGV